MKFPKTSSTLAGALFLAGAAQFLIAMMLGESIAPGYNMHDDAISDLGIIASTSTLFNTSIIILGIMIIAGALFYHRVHEKGAITALIVLSGIGAAGAGVFNLNYEIHGIFALMAFLFIPLAAILHVRRLPLPLGLISAVLGITSLIALVLMVLFDSGTEISAAIGHGGTERMIAYPVLIWLVGMGGYLMARSTEARAE